MRCLLLSVLWTMAVTCGGLTVYPAEQTIEPATEPVAIQPDNSALQPDNSAIQPDNSAVTFSLNALREQAATIDELRIPFRQIKELELFERPVVTEGVLDISRPLACVRWEFTDRAVLVLRNDVVRKWRADGQREHVHNGPATQSLHSQMKALLTGDWMVLDRLFSIAIEADQRRLLLTPRNRDLARYVSTVALTYNASLTAPHSLIISAPGGDRTSYEFGAIEDPGELTVAHFEGP